MSALFTETDGVAAWLQAAVVVFAATLVLTRLAKRLPKGSLHDPAPSSPDAERARKTQLKAVPLVGGLALLGGLVLAGLGQVDAGFESIGLVWPGVLACWSALGLAFLVGFVDDALPAGLVPGAKFAAQCSAGLPLGFGMWSGLAESDQGGIAGLFALLLAAALAAAVAQNALNTFDNADGVATGITALGMSLVSPVIAAGLLGFLPFNLSTRKSGASEQRATPRAYLGDSGSHLLGMCILLTPPAWPLLALPLFDLARLSVERLQRGSRPWRGDRFHLAHLLEARGHSSLAVLALLALIAAPSILFGTRGIQSSRPELVLVGVAGTGVFYLLSLLFVRAAKAPIRKLFRSEIAPQSETTSVQ